MQSSAFGRGLASASLDQDLQRNMNMAMLDMEQRNMGAQGLANQMPQFLAQPSMMEQMFVRGRQPFQQQNHQAQMQQQQAINNYLQQLAFYQPDRMETPSNFQMMMDPLSVILGGALRGFTGGLF